MAKRDIKEYECDVCYTLFVEDSPSIVQDGNTMDFICMITIKELNESEDKVYDCCASCHHEIEKFIESLDRRPRAG